MNQTDTTRRGRPRDPAADQAILDAARSVVAEKGFNGASMDEIARRAGVGKDTLYRRWKSKEELVLHLLKVMSEQNVPAPRLEDPRYGLFVFLQNIRKVNLDTNIGSIIAGLVSYPLNKLMGSNKDKPAIEKSYLEMFVVEGFTIPQIPSIVVRSAQITGILAPLIAVSVVMQQILSLLGAQQTIGDFVTGMGGYYAVLFTSMVIVFFSGMVLESLPVTIILAPILAPIAASVGIDPVHFSVIFLVGASIGFITPPYGLNLYVASGVTGVPYFRLLRYTVPYLIALISVWFLVALVPDIALVLLPSR